MINPVSTASQQHHASIKVTTPLVENVQHQSNVPQTDLLQQHTKTELKTKKASFLNLKNCCLICHHNYNSVSNWDKKREISLADTFTNRETRLCLA